MEMNIPARTVNAVLHTIQEISGPQYDLLLERAGWTRFRGNIPEESGDLIATRAELESLFANVYTLLGEGLMRLFLRNFGWRAAPQMLAMNWGAASRALAATVPLPQHLAWFAAEMIEVSRRSWTPAVLTEDAHAYYITFDRCPMCAGIHGASAPICAAIEALYGQLAQHLIWTRLRVVEVACAAMGAPHCKVALYK